MELVVDRATDDKLPAVIVRGHNRLIWRVVHKLSQRPVPTQSAFSSFEWMNHNKPVLYIFRPPATNAKSRRYEFIYFGPLSCLSHGHPFLALQRRDVLHATVTWTKETKVCLLLVLLLLTVRKRNCSKKPSLGMPLLLPRRPLNAQQQGGCSR
jgi:hypothetical protein